MKHKIASRQVQGSVMARFAKLPVLLSSMVLAGLAHAELAIQSVTSATQGGSEVIRIQTSEPLK